MSARRDRPSRPWLLYGLAAVAVAVIVLAITEIGAPTSSARTSREVVTAGQGVVQSTVTGSGNVAAGTDVNVNFNTSGTLQDVYVHVGQHVKAGQLLADLDPTAAQLSLNQAQESLTAAQDNLNCVEGETSDCGSGGRRRAPRVRWLRRRVERTCVDDELLRVGRHGGVRGLPPRHHAGFDEAGLDQAEVTTPTGSSQDDDHGTKTTPSVTVTVVVPSTKAGRAPAQAGASSAPKTTSSTTTTSTPSPGSIASAQASVYSAEASVHNAETAVNKTKLYAPVSGTIASLSSLTAGDAVSGGGSGKLVVGAPLPRRRARPPARARARPPAASGASSSSGSVARRAQARGSPRSSTPTR